MQLDKKPKFFYKLHTNLIINIKTMETFFDILISLSLVIGGICLAWLVEKRPATQGWRIFLKCLVQLCVISVIVCLCAFYQKMPDNVSASISQTISYVFLILWGSIVLLFIGYMIIIPVKTHRRIIDLICPKIFSENKEIIASSFFLSELTFVITVILCIYNSETVMQAIGLATMTAFIIFFALICILLILSWLINLLFFGIKKYWLWLKD